MANGPFQSYAPPGVYTTTQVATSLSGPPAGIQIPVFLGVGQETLTETDLELVRGSSSSVDQQIVNEDVSEQFVVDNINPQNPILGDADGSTSLFRVMNYPIVVGDGQGLTSNRPQDVQVTVDGVQVVVARVVGATGIVQLQVPPPAGSVVKVTYFFNRTDTQATDDLSGQVSSASAVIKAPFAGAYTVVSGTNDELVLTVNGASATLTLTSGTFSAANLAIDINSNQIEGLTASADLDNQGQSRLQLSAEGSLVIGDGSSNGLFGFNAGQSTNRNRVFTTYNGPIVDGSNGGITTTNVNDVTVLVNGNVVIPESVDGSNRAITLSEPPLVNSTVEVTYFHNTFQNTFDYLPNEGVTTVDRLGNAPGRNDYIQGNDYIILNDRVLWGSAVTIEPGRVTPGSTVFDDSQITTSLVDARIYLENVERLQDTSVSPARPSSTVVVLGNIPVKGDGRDTPTNDPSLVEIYHGPTLQTALAAGRRTVKSVSSSNRRVTLVNPIPAGDMIWATYYYSRLLDDTVTLTRTASGRFTAFSDLRGENLYNVRFGTSSAVDTIQWPSGVQSDPDAFYLGADGVNETITVTFTEVGAVGASFTNDLAGPYDIFTDASDKMGLVLNDGGRGITNDAVTVDLDVPAFAVIVGEANEPATNFVVVLDENDTFAFTLDDTNYELTIPAGTYTIQEIAEYIWRYVPTLATYTGANTETFDLSVGRDYDVTINGTNVTGTLPVLTATETAADTAAAWITQIETDSGAALSGGDLTDPANDFNIVGNTDGTVTISASETLQIDDAGGATDLEDILGFATLATTATNIKIARTWEGGDKEYILLRSRTTPSTLSDTSRIRILSGSANDLIGFSAFQESFGTLSAVNEGATILSGSISATAITNLEVNEEDFVVSIDGTEYTVPGASFDGIASIGDIVTAIDAVIGAAGANVATVVVEDTDKIRITSLQDDATSAVDIGTGDANQYLNFTDNDSASQRRPTADQIVTVLNNDTAAWADETDVDLATLAAAGEFLNAFYATALEVAGAGTYVQFNSFNTGVDVSITFADGTETVYNDTGIGIEVGDTASGADGVDGFTVTSSNPAGSGGSGVIGQTYTDEDTGLRFTVLASEDGDYTTGQDFTLISEEQMLTGSSVVNKSIPGIEMTVTSLADITAGDTAIVTAYDKSGDEPGIGDFYYITYNYQKEDFSTQFYTRIREVVENYGPLSPDNPLTLGSYLALLNGASVVAARQVPKAPDQQQATAAGYISALQDLRRPLAGGLRPDLIVPLTTDTSVFSEIVKFTEIQSSPRYRNEMRAFFGTASGTRPADASALARGLNSERAVLVYPDSAILSIDDELGNSTQFIVDGSFIAAALAGATVSPAFDVATPMTRKRITGFDRLNRSLDEIEANTLATNGVTVLEDSAPNLRVRQGLTTNVSNRLTSIPSVIAIRDFVQKQARATLDRFIGLKFLAGRAQDVELALTGLLNSLVENQIITAFTGVSATPDPNDPTMLNVEAFYSPVFPLLFIDIRFTISSSL